MAKKIFLSEAEINAILENVKTQLRNKKFQTNNGVKLDINSSLFSIEDTNKALLVFSQNAWIKILALVTNFSTEIEWHGTVERLSDSTFLVNDILVFPHEVTGSTVTSDQKEYEEWSNSLDDATFNALRLHGHSHVNMGVTPSSTDRTYRENFINNFGTPNENTDYFYIYIICNKKNDINIEIYDLQNNIFYDEKEIDFTVMLDGNNTLEEFLEESKKVVTERRSTYYTGNSQAFPTAPTKTSYVKPNTNVEKKTKEEEKEDDNNEDKPWYERYGCYNGLYGR